MVNADDLVPNDWNPNEMDNKTFDRLRKEIQERGFQGNPLIVRKHPKQKDPEFQNKWEIIDGEHRWKAGKAEGMTQFPCSPLVVPEELEAQFRTFVFNNLRGEINEIKLAVLVNNWKQKGLPSGAVYDRTGIRISQQKALLEKLKPGNISAESMRQGNKGQHKSLAVILDNESYEIVHRAIKLTRLRGEADSIIEMCTYFTEKHELSLADQTKLQGLLKDLESDTNAEGLVKIATYYLATVKKDEIRR